MASSPHRAVLHVGTPKSGTTFVQKILWDNPDVLRAQGFRCAGGRQRDMFLAAIELRESNQFWGYPPDEIAGRWSAVSRQAREHTGTTILSHELLGSATEEQVARAMADLDGTEVHVVVTARDLARQATSEWQERIKNGSSRSFTSYERRLRQQMRKGNLTSGFWRNQDLVGILDRWARDLPPSQVHVVVAPQSAADPGLLWRRFADALGLESQDIDPSASQRSANSSLGVAQIAVLRHVNEALAGRIEHPTYANVVKSQFAERLLASQKSDRPQCPPLLVARLREVAEDRTETIRQRGYVVHGDLDELVPLAPEGDYQSPDDVDLEAERAAYAEAIAALLVQRSTRQQRLQIPDAGPTPTTRERMRSLGRFLDDRIRRR